MDGHEWDNHDHVSHGLGPYMDGGREFSDPPKILSVKHANKILLFEYDLVCMSLLALKR